MAKNYFRVQGGVAVEVWTLNGTQPLSAHWPNAADWVDVTNADPAPQIGWNWDGRVWSAPAPVAPPIPDALARLAFVHDQIEAKGVWYQPQSATSPMLFATDPANIGRITGAYAAANSSPSKWVDGTPIRSANNLYVPMSTEDVIGLAEKALGYIAQCAASAAKVAEIIGTTNPAVDVTADNWWPSNA